MPQVVPAAHRPCFMPHTVHASGRVLFILQAVYCPCYRRCRSHTVHATGRVLSMLQAVLRSVCVLQAVPEERLEQLQGLEEAAMGSTSSSQKRLASKLHALVRGLAPLRRVCALHTTTPFRPLLLPVWGQPMGASCGCSVPGHRLSQWMWCLCPGTGCHNGCGAQAPAVTMDVVSVPGHRLSRWMWCTGTGCHNGCGAQAPAVTMDVVHRHCWASA